MKQLRRGLLLLFALAAAGCSGLAPRNPPTYAPSAPTAILGRVIELRERGAWIDFDNAFVSYDSVVIEILAPVDAAGKRLYLQYQGEPSAHGLVIRPGQVLAFTLPVVPSSQCCEPYLGDLADLREVAAGN